MASYLVQEADGTSRLILEDASGDLLLEISVPSVTTTGGDDWAADGYILASLLRPPPKPKKRRKVLLDDEEAPVFVSGYRIDTRSVNHILDEAELEAVLAVMASV